MEILFILLLMSVLAFWWYSTVCRETAVRFAREACKRLGVQLLDETVSLTKMRLQRTNRGHMSIERWYTFEFSASGIDRRSGTTKLLGDKLLEMHLNIDVDELSQESSIHEKQK